jgi:aspartyl-tRNA(Asn)/glutamyl-tRNA(Gln) amidotransferase subunit A
MIDLEKLTILEARKKLDSKEFTAVDLAQAYLNEIKEKNENIHAYLEVFSDILEQAKKADEAISRGEIFPMTGIPIAVKDNILIDGRTATSASKILQNFIAPYDSTAIKKLKAQNAVFLGRTNMDEFAMGSSTENSAYGPTKNPLDTTRVPGGSSGGSVAAVAMHGAIAALGSDTGGSIREPAAFCGLVGLKPTYGGISRYGLMAMGSSFDIIGPITKTVSDSEILFNAVKGQDKMDSTTYGENIYSKKNKIKKIGIPYHILEKGLPKETRENFDQAVEKLKSLGFEIQDIKLPNVEYSLPVYYILVPAEISSNLARFDGVKYGLHVDGDNLLDDYLKTRREGFGPEVRRRILVGTYVLSAGYHDAYYNKATILRQKISEELSEVFKDVDLILTPTTPEPAFKIGEKANDPLSLYLMDVFTVPANIAGVPAITLPSGTISVEGKDLPLGVQFMAPHDCENLLFEVGKKFLGE